MTTKVKKPRENSDRTPTNWAFSILTTTTSDTDPSFIIDFEQPGAKYIFNAGENTIRAFSQSKWGLVKTEGVFLTGVRGQTSGGLSSLLMSLADCGPRFPRMQVFGPPGLKHLLASMRMYMYRDNLPVVSNEVPFGEFHPNHAPNPIFKDSNITVYAIPIYPSGSGSVSSSHFNTNASESSLKRKRSLDSVEAPLPLKKQIIDGSVISGEIDVPMSAVDHSSSSTSLNSLFSSPSFSPHTFSPNNLTPSQAEEWRDVMVNVMFPAVKSVKHDTLKNTGKGKDSAPAPKKAEFVRKDKFGSAAENTGNIDDYNRPMLLKGYYSQLPRFTLVEAESQQTASSSSDAKTPNPVLPSAFSLSYLVIGPRIRGKFDGAKADAMAIPRPLRSKLAKGETIQFKRKKLTSSDSATAETETITVTPGELLAASIPAAAVLILDVPSPIHVPSLFEAFRGQNGYARWTGWKDRNARDVEAEREQEMKMKDESDIQDDFILRTVIHLCGDGVWENQMYREFIAGFGEQEEIHHILSSKSHLPDPLTFTSSGYHQLKLNHLDPEIFKVPKWKLEADKNLRDDGGDLPAPPTNLTLMKCHTIIPMRPPGPPQKAKWALENDRFHCHVNGESNACDPVAFETTDTGSKDKDESNEMSDKDRLDSTDVLETAFTVTSSSGPSTLVLKPMTAAAFSQGRDAVKAFSETEEMRKAMQAVKGADVGIITLGTGSAVPGKYRNVSATAIQIPKYGNILLDCGEGTWGQLCRFFGTETSSSSMASTQNVYQFLRDLKCIYISHVHADHHLGLANMLRMRKKLHPQPTHPCYLVTIRPVLLYLRELSDLEDLGLVYGDENPSTNSSSNKNGVIPVLTPALHWKQADSYLTSGTWSVGGAEEWLDMAKSRANAEDMCRSLGLKTFHTVDVRHRCRCYGAVIKSEDGWSVVFSADTMPSDSLVYAGQGASVLIHEATMTDDQEGLATQKAHSTVGQAITVGKRMRASNILLTHFSARQPKIPHQISDYPSSSSTRDSTSGDVSPFIVTAFDYANLTIGNMWKMQFYMAAIEQSYQEMLIEVGELEEAEEEEREKLARAGG